MIEEEDDEMEKILLEKDLKIQELIAEKERLIKENKTIMNQKKRRRKKNISNKK